MQVSNGEKALRQKEDVVQKMLKKVSSNGSTECLLGGLFYFYFILFLQCSILQFPL